MSQSTGLKSILYALSANLAIFVLKLGAAIFTGSGAMLAEAVHSLADSGNQLLLLVGLAQSKKKPTAESPLGFGKEIYFWSFVVALVMFLLGGVFSMYEGIHKLTHLENLQAPYLAIGVIVISILLEGASLLGCMKEIQPERRKRTIFQWFRETRNSTLLVVFGEDLAAQVGLAIALLSIVLTMIFKNPIFDACGSILIGLLLICIAIAICIEVKSLLVGQSIDPVLRDEMHVAIAERPEVAEVYSFLSLQLGTQMLVSIRARMHPTGSEAALIKNIMACEAFLKETYPTIQWLFFEPELNDQHV